MTHLQYATDLQSNIAVYVAEDPYLNELAKVELQYLDSGSLNEYIQDALSLQIKMA